MRRWHMAFRRPAPLVVVASAAALGSACGGSSPTGPEHTVPTIEALVPAIVTAGTVAIPFTVQGHDFDTASVVRIDDADVSTTFVSPDSLVAMVPASVRQAAGFHDVTVFTGPPGGGASDPASLQVILPTHPGGGIEQSLAFTGRIHGVAAAANGRFCVSLIDADAIACGMVTGSTQWWTNSIPVGRAPAHVALSPDGTRAYTANQFGASVSVVDIGAGTVVATIPLSDGGFNLLVSPDGSRLYVTTAAGRLHIVNTATNEVITSFDVGAAANGLAFDSLAGLLYVSSRDAGTVTAVSAATDSVTRTYAVGGLLQRIGLSPDGATLYAASETNGLVAIDVTTGAADTLTAVAPGTVGLAVAPDGAQAYETNPPGGFVGVVDLKARTVVRTIALTRPRNVTFALGGVVALIADEGGEVYFIR